MKIYTFWSADTTYITKSKSLRKAQEIGKENMQLYLEQCAYLGDEQDIEFAKSLCIPDEVNEETVEFAKYLVRTDKDIMVLEDDTERYLLQ